ncbi:hypothetical protein B2J93_6386 [Marssonina coronariae]|uniref:Uncharacterized protein n=1 Tax=Diplocarpon coronariae TaxID=2795749 RepID=A0A218Z2K1_9HELO|nr:hypothetical protein B2J93_6386 [Marssonina coronariae]
MHATHERPDDTADLDSPNIERTSRDAVQRARIGATRECREDSNESALQPIANHSPNMHVSKRHNHAPSGITPHPVPPRPGSRTQALTPDPTSGPELGSGAGRLQDAATTSASALDRADGGELLVSSPGEGRPRDAYAHGTVPRATGA